MLDDQRDPKERGTIFAERGDFLSSDQGIFLLLANGAVHRHEAGKQDPVIVRFKEYAFDLSRLSPNAGPVTFAVHERSIRDLVYPQPDDATFKRMPGQFRAELHNRITTPLYPLAFLFVTFAFLGAPRTTRQSRAMSLVGAIAVVSAVRALGFVGTIAGVQSPLALIVPYLGLAVAFFLGGWAMARGVVIEPPAAIANLVNATLESIRRRTAMAVGQHP
jgi:lipopolysaccharide export system permease protein